MQREVKYLGHIISKAGIRTDPDKIESIHKWNLPNCKKELQEFLGLCNYYRTFKKDFATIAEPLYAMLRKGCDLGWTDEKIAGFTRLKTALMSPPVLKLPCPDGKYILDTDASHNSIGAVLSQIKEGKEHVIAYASKNLTKSQRLYCITRKELLAIYVFVLKFKHYLLGIEFEVRTDHQELK